MDAEPITVQACRRAAPSITSSRQDFDARNLPTVLGFALALCVSAAMWAGLILVGIRTISLF